MAKRGSFSKQSSTITVSTGVVSESRRFTSPSSIGTYRTTEVLPNGSTMIPICRWGCTCSPTGDEIDPDALRVSCNKVLPNSSMLPAKPRRHRVTNHPEYADKGMKFFLM